MDRQRQTETDRQTDIQIDRQRQTETMREAHTRAHARTRVCTHTHTHTHARTHARTHTHAHTHARTRSHSLFVSLLCLSLSVYLPKPGKDHLDPSNFRPKALTSCLCKTMERMINARLMWSLESQGLPSEKKKL